MMRGHSIVALAMVFCAVLPAAADLQTTAYCNSDTWLNGRDSGKESNNYGSDYYLHVYGETNSGNNTPVQSTLVKFTLPSLGSGYHIQGATVRMNYATYDDMDSGDHVSVGLYAVRSTRVWTEMGATWYTMNGSSYWGQSGCESASWDRYDTLLGSQVFYRSTTGGDKDWTNSSLAQVVRDWYSGSLTNNGLVARTYEHETGREGVLLYSREYGSGWGPRLIINYTLDPTADADGNYSVAPGGNVNFNGTGSSDPDGGGISSWLWDLDNDGQYDDGSGSILNKTYDYLVNTLLLTPGEHTVGLKVLDDEGEWDTDASVLTVTPEPATLLLLALGGLALARRRRTV